jgi:hypothetical protein
MPSTRQVTIITITFTAARVEALRYERYHHPHPRVHRKMDTLYLRSQGYAHGENDTQTPVFLLLSVPEFDKLRHSGKI